MSRPTLELRTLGGLSLRRSNEALPGAGAQRARLAILAAIGLAGDRGISRDRLLLLFWPDSDTDRARGALKQALYALRQSAGAPDLTIGTSELRLNPAEIVCDAVEFERAIAAGEPGRAAALYGGPFLDGVHLREAPEFERWVEGARDRLERVHLAALEQLARRAETRGDRGEAAEWWRRLAAADPLSAPTAVSLMNSLAAMGDTAAALRHARVFAALTAAELGVPADATVIEAADRIRAIASASRTGSPPAAAPEDTAPGEASPPVAVETERHTTTEPADGTGVATVEPRPPERPPGAGRMAGKPRAGLIPVVAAIATAIAAIALLPALVRSGRPTDAAAERILIERFSNQTGDPELDDAAHLVTEWVTQGLAAAGLVEVIDSRSARPVAFDPARTGDTGRAAGLEHARELGATTLVRGTMFRNDADLVVQTRIVQASDGTVLSTPQSVTLPAANPTALAEAVRQAVLGAFAALYDPRFSPWARATSAPPRYDAWLEFANGLDQLALGNMVDAHEAFMRASRMDTTFLQAMIMALDVSGAGVGAIDSLLGAVRRRRDRLTPFDQASLDRAVAIRRVDRDGEYRASRRMVELAPWSSDAAYYLASAALGTSRFREAWQVLHAAPPAGGWHANAEYLRTTDRFAHHMAGEFAAELAESEVEANAAGAGYGTCMISVRPLAAMGDAAGLEGLSHRCRARPGVPPSDGAILHSAGLELLEHGHLDLGRDYLQRARESFASEVRPREDAILRVDWALGNWDALERFWSARLAEGPLDARGYAQLGVAAAHLNDDQTAREMVRRLSTEWPDELHWRAMIPAALGELDEAVQLMREAQQKGYNPAYNGHTQPGFQPLRGYPSFEALRRPRG